MQVFAQEEKQIHLFQLKKIKVNNVIQTELGIKINQNDVVTYNGRVLKTEKFRYILINKPKIALLHLKILTIEKQ